jgi:hypothetical protein
MKLDIFDYERPVGIQIFGGDERQWPYLLKSLQQFDLI